jgi:diguanylate cyclase (GGDEF)-like protein/PAS domain S-box-containing protein
MKARRWSRAELLTLVRDARLMALNSAAGMVEAPDWLQAVASDELDSASSSDGIERLHPHDRSRLIELYLATVEEPGALRSGRFRALVGGQWSHLSITAVNLLDDEEIGCVLIVMREVDGGTIDSPYSDTDASHTTTDWMLLTLNESGMITTVDGNAEALLGYEPDELIGLAPTSLIHPDHLVDSIRLWRALIEQPHETRTSQRRWIRKTGEEIWIESSYVNRGEGFSESERYLVVVWDITARRVAEQALREQTNELMRMAEDFRSLADEVPAAVFRCTADGSVLFHNSRWVDLLQGRSEVARLQDLLGAASREILDTALSAGRKVGAAGRETIELEGDDGRTWSLTLRLLKATGGGPSEFLGSLQDISQTVRLREEATRDGLTGLLNRAAIENELNQVLAEGTGDAVVAFVDLDRFKAVNDTWGHDAGDVVLTEVARRLVGAVRSTDSVGRWGGDEFVVLFRATTSFADGTLVELLKRAFDDPVDFGASTWDPAASIGVALPQAGDDIDTLIGRADQAMLARKRKRANPSR